MFFRTLSCRSCFHIWFSNSFGSECFPYLISTHSVSSLCCFVCYVERYWLCIVLWSMIRTRCAHERCIHWHNIIAIRRGPIVLLSFASQVSLGLLCIRHCFPPRKWNRLTIIARALIIHIMCPMEDFNPYLFHMMNLPKPTLFNQPSWFAEFTRFKEY